MSWPEKTSPTIDASEKRSIGKGVFRKCDGCGSMYPGEDLSKNHEVCPACEIGRAHV